MNIRKYLTKKNILIGLSVIVIITVAIIVFFLLKPTINGTCKNGEYMCENSSSSKKNNCIPSNFCSDFPGLINNKDNCSCAKSCPAGYTSFPEDPGMRLNDNNKWEPSVELFCGTPCEYSPDKFCTDTSLCGQVMNDDKKVLDQGCKPKSQYIQCPNAVCPKTYGCSTAGYCNIPYCGLNNDKVYACMQDTDCNDGVTQTKCILTDPNLNIKGIDNVGYCGPTPSGGKLKKLADQYCLNKNEIGQKQEQENNTYTYSIVSCPGSDGVNTVLQCSEALNGYCSKYGICDNKWQAKIDNSTNSNCVIGNWNNHKLVTCCDPAHIIHPAESEQFCCLETSRDCRNETKYPYSGSLIPNTNLKNLSDKIQCNNDNDCVVKHNKDFQNTLGLTGAKPSDENYASLFCGTGATAGATGYCYAYCGYVNKDSSSGYKAPYTVYDDSDKGYSFCIPKDLGCQLQSSSTWTSSHEPVNNIPICYAPPLNETSKFYWSNKIGDKSAEFESEFTKQIDQSKSSVCNNPNICASDAARTEGVYKVELVGGNTCKYTMNCSTSLVTPSGASTSLNWKDLSTPTNLNSAFTQDPNWTTSKIYQTRKNTAPINNSCDGETNGFTPYLTTSPQSFAAGHDCDEVPDTHNGNYSLSYDGEYCKIDEHGACRYP